MSAAFDNISAQLKEKGYDHALAIATDAEVQAGAACGQLALIVDATSTKE